VATSASTTIGSTGKYGDLKRRLFFLLMRCSSTGSVRTSRCLALTRTVAPALQFAAGRHPRPVQHVLGWCAVALFGVCAGDHAVHIGVDHHADADLCAAFARGVAQGSESGRRKITQYTRYGTLGLAIFQAIGISVALESQQGLVLDRAYVPVHLRSVACHGHDVPDVAGEQITERGLGNGISILIFAGIVAGLRRRSVACSTGSHRRHQPARRDLHHRADRGRHRVRVFVERGQRKITVNYAKRQVGNKIYGGQSSFLPLKLNMSA